MIAVGGFQRRREELENRPKTERKRRNATSRYGTFKIPVKMDTSLFKHNGVKMENDNSEAEIAAKEATTRGCLPKSNLAFRRRNHNELRYEEKFEGKKA